MEELQHFLRPLSNFVTMTILKEKEKVIIFLVNCQIFYSLFKVNPSN